MFVVNRIAWSTYPPATSLYRSSPGRIGRPAASAEVQPFGRSALLVSSQVAPDPARQVPLTSRVFQVSYNRQVLLSTMIACLSPGEFRPPSILVSAPSGYPTWSLSLE